jgi:threonine synthase
MNYFSTRDKSKKFSFKEVFLRGLAPDGGLFVPESLKKFSSEELNELKKLNYTNLATEIVSYFCGEDINKKELKRIIEKSYYSFLIENVVSVKNFDHLNILELYHGPTLAFKDIAMQVIGNLYLEFKEKNKPINIIVATSGDTGAAAVSALKQKNDINLFVLHPHNKISNMQRKIMTSENFYFSNKISKNIFNIAVKGTFDDCQNLVKQMFNDNNFRKKINMSGVNSINWARIIFQIVYYFYSYFKISTDEKINYSVPTGNFGDVYAGYLAKKMGLPINKLIVSTNENDILQRVINTGEYKPTKVKPSISPSMDIQVASNFERLIFDALNCDDNAVISLMNELKNNGNFKLKKETLDYIQRYFSAIKITDDETSETIKKIFKKYNFLVDPHTAIGIKAEEKINNKMRTVCLATAHPYKFVETVEKIVDTKMEIPVQGSFLGPKEKYVILENDMDTIKKFIESKL